MAENSDRSDSASTTKKSDTRKSGSTKASSTKKSAAGKASGSSRAQAPRAEAGRRMGGPQAAQAALRQLAELTGKEVEGITSLQKAEEGWQVELDVLELRRIPATTDVLATYEVAVDTSGDLTGYRRLGRYARGQAEDGP